MDLLFVPRQEEDPNCKYIGMYYSLSYERKNLCDIESTLLTGESISIKPASNYDIRVIKEMILGTENTTA